MEIGLDAAVSFVATHARVIDRRRLQLLLDGGSTAGLLAALDAYRNPDGGYGWGLEPDQRSSTSQPVAAMHALEVLAAIRDDSTRAVGICDWLGEHALPDGGTPFSLPHSDTQGSAPHWIGADTETSSLQMTAQLAAQAHRLARHHKDIADHPWLAGATSYCLDAVNQIDAAPHPYELMFVFLFLDAVTGHDAEAERLLKRLRPFVSIEGPTSVAEAEGEVLQVLDFSPFPDTRSRRLLGEATIAAELHRLASRQQPDGGWQVTFPSYSPAAALEWRGHATVQAVATLQGSATL